MSDLSISTPSDAASLLQTYSLQKSGAETSAETFLALTKSKGFLELAKSKGFALPEADDDGMIDLKKTKNAAKDKLTQAKRLAETAKQFEGVFVQKLVDTMKNTIGESGLFNDTGAKQIHGMFWQFLSDDISSKSSMGLAKNLYEDFCRTNGLKDAPEFSTLESLQ